MAGKYGNIINKAKSGKPDDQTTSKPGKQITSKPDEKKVGPTDPPKNLCVKVPESWRRHWSIQAKIQGVTMTDVMVEALTAKFGLPDDQMTR